MTDAKNKAVQDLQTFRADINTRFQGVQPSTPKKAAEYANNPFGPEPTAATAATGGGPPPPPAAGTSGAKPAPPPPPGGAKKPEPKKADGKDSSEEDTDSEAEPDEEEVSPAVNWKQESKEEGLYHLIMDNSALKKDNEKLKKDLREALGRLHEIQLKQGPAAGAKILKPVVPPKPGALAVISAVAKDALESVVANIGEHIIADDVRLHDKDKIVYFCVKSCASSADSASAGLVDVTNWALKSVNKVLKKKKKNLAKMRHHWIEVSLPVGFVLIQKHPNGCISMDFATEASAVREMALEASNMVQNDIPSGQEDIKIEEEDSDPGVRVLSEVLKFVESQPAKYRSVDMNSKKFALDVIKWYKARDAEGKTA